MNKGTDVTSHAIHEQHVNVVSESDIHGQTNCVTARQQTPTSIRERNKKMYKKNHSRNKTSDAGGETVLNGTMNTE